ncbi:MAG: hypothetical protein D3922_07095 [Candidatus Electrothrix sp. AR1]|nr:hypothetical protein [Candidatus Electrothrix sp. AR1]
MKITELATIVGAAGGVSGLIALLGFFGINTYKDISIDCKQLLYFIFKSVLITFTVGFFAVLAFLVIKHYNDISINYLKLSIIAGIASGLIALLGFFGINNYKNISIDYEKPLYKGIFGFYTNILERIKRNNGLILLFQNNYIYPSKSIRYIYRGIIKNKHQVARISKYKHPQIEQIVFTPQGRRVTLFFIKGKRNQDVCYPVFEEKNRRDFQTKIEDLCNIGAIPKQIAFAPNGSWTILYDLKGRRACEVSEGHSRHYGFTEKINALSRGKSEFIQHIAFTPVGGWVILVNKMGRDYPYFNNKVKDNYPELIGEVERNCRQRKKIKQILFISEQDGIILFRDGSYYPPTILPKDLKRKVDSYEKKNIRLKQIAVMR